MIPPVLFSMPDAAPAPGVLPSLTTSFAGLLTEQLPAEPPPEAEPAVEAEPALEDMPLAFFQLSQQPLPEPPAAEAPLLAAELPVEAAALPPEDAPEPAPAELAEVEAELPEAPAEPVSFEPLPAPAEAPLAQVGEGAQPEGPVRGLSAVEAPPPAAEVAVESGEEPQVQIRPEGLDRLSLRVNEGGERLEVEIERGVDRSLDIRVLAPPEAIDELSAMESELQRSLEERALRLGSYSAEARDRSHDAPEGGEGSGAPGEGAAADAEGEDAPLPEWSMGLLNIRA